jgi:hypothetical protein
MMTAIRSMSNARLVLALRRLANGLTYSDDVLLARHHANEIEAFEREQTAAMNLAAYNEPNDDDDDDDNTDDAPRDGRDADNEDNNT